MDSVNSLVIKRFRERSIRIGAYKVGGFMGTFTDYEYCDDYAIGLDRKFSAAINSDAISRHIVNVPGVQFTGIMIHKCILLCGIEKCNSWEGLGNLAFEGCIIQDDFGNL